MKLPTVSLKIGCGFIASIPLLIGCQSDGYTSDEAIANLKVAHRWWLETALNNDEVIPIPQ